MSEQSQQGERRDQGREAQRATELPELESQEAPLKQHGDALRDGSGNRHGVLQEDRETGGGK